MIVASKDGETSMLSSIPEALDDLRAGKMVILTDDEDRENEGDLVFAAGHVTPEKINFMAKHGRGLICVASSEHRLRELGLKAITTNNTTNFGTNFYEPIDAVKGTTTGVSAHDRATTIRAFIDPQTRPADLA